LAQNSQAALRRSTRVQVRIPVTISGALPEGQPFSEETFILTVSKFGARLKVRTCLQTGMQVTVSPKLRKESAQFRVVWTGRAGTLREGEAGIEYVKVSNLLGISFP
jgi:hypothetical protein